MEFEIEIDGPRMIATQTGTLDWQDSDRAFARCEAVLTEHPEVTQLLLDLSRARIALSLSEASDLADLAILTFSRPLKTAILCPAGNASRFIQPYVTALRDRGARVQAFDSLDQARAYLQPRRHCVARTRSALATLQRPLAALAGRVGWR